MQIASILESSTAAASSAQQESKTSSSFASYFTTASDSDSDSSSGSNSVSDSGDSAVEEFMNYAKETPAQRMFDSWLTSQNITEQEYNAMTPAQQQALVHKFEVQMEAKLKSESLESSESAALASFTTAAVE